MNQPTSTSTELESHPSRAARTRTVRTVNLQAGMADWPITQASPFVATRTRASARPVIEATVGDTLVVHFSSQLPKPIGEGRRPPPAAALAGRIAVRPRRH